MDLEKLQGRMISFWTLHVSGWLVFAASTVIFAYTGNWTDVPHLLRYLAPYLVGFLSCLPLRYCYKAVRLHERPWPQSFLGGLAASFIGANLWLGIDLAISLFIHLPPYMKSPVAFIRRYPELIYKRGVPLLAWTFLYLVIKIRRDWKQQQERTAKANALAQTAQLQMLRYQLNPHFLFNSMNSIRALIDEDEAKARELITELSEFLRYSLDSKDFADVPLKHELEAIRHYFAIQKKRYEDKLEVTYEIEPEAEEYPILSFLVHPLVENAVKYGMRTSPLPLRIELKAKIRDGALRIEVINTGRWIEQDTLKGQINGGTGTGLENVRLRLENAFPQGHRLEVVEKEGRVHVQLEIRKGQGSGDEKSL